MQEGRKEGRREERSMKGEKKYEGRKEGRKMKDGRKKGRKEGHQHNKEGKKKRKAGWKGAIYHSKLAGIGARGGHEPKALAGAVLLLRLFRLAIVNHTVKQILV
jgi:hypothetical protein